MNQIIEIKEEVQIGSIILEKGDKIKIMEEGSFKLKAENAEEKLELILVGSSFNTIDFLIRQYPYPMNELSIDRKSFDELARHFNYSL